MKSRRRCARTVFSILAVVASALSAIAQPEPSIELEPPIDCWYHDAFPQLDAAIVPDGDVSQTRLYFRCLLYQDYYFVDLTRGADGYRAVGPKAEENCGEVSYYVEVLRSDFSSSRTSEHTADVTAYGECRRRNPATAFLDGDPDLLVGTTSPGLTQLLGFKPDGVISFLSASGDVVALGGSSSGGLSTPAIIGIGAGGAGAAVAVIAGGGGDDGGDAPSAPPPPVTGPVAPPPAPPAPTPPAGPTVSACIETNPPSAAIQAGQSIQLDARCSTGQGLSFSWDLGDGRSPRTGALINPIYRNPGDFLVTLTVSQAGSSLRRSGTGSLSDVVDTATVRVSVSEAPAALVACFDAKVLNPGASCDMEFNASCSTGDIVSYEWLLDSTDVLGFGAVPASGVIVTHDWASACGFSAPWPQVQTKLTVFDAQGNSNVRTRGVGIQYLRSPFLEEQRLPTSFSSFLGVRPFDGATLGQVHFNRSHVDLVSNKGTVSHQVDGRFGTNVVEAHTTTPLAGPGHWRFDFGGARGFVSGSLRVQSGQAIAVESRAIIFRLTGSPGERIRFVYELMR